MTEHLLNNPASWVIRNKETKEVIMETFDYRRVQMLNTAKYEATPIVKYLADLNKVGLNHE